MHIFKVLGHRNPSLTHQTYNKNATKHVEIYHDDTDVEQTHADIIFMCSALKIVCSKMYFHILKLFCYL
jgi:hypothetical protein